MQRKLKKTEMKKDSKETWYREKGTTRSLDLTMEKKISMEDWKDVEKIHVFVAKNGMPVPRLLSLNQSRLGLFVQVSV